MANKISYLYTARDKKSFDFLAVDAAKCGATVTIDPGQLTILLTTTGDKVSGTSDDLLRNLRDVIDTNELDVDVQPTDTDIDLLNRIADLTRKNEALKAERDQYARWHFEDGRQAARIRKQIAAIAVLIEAVGR